MFDHNEQHDRVLLKSRTYMEIDLANDYISPKDVAGLLRCTDRHERELYLRDRFSPLVAKISQRSKHFGDTAIQWGKAINPNKDYKSISFNERYINRPAQKMFRRSELQFLNIQRRKQEQKQEIKTSVVKA